MSHTRLRRYNARDAFPEQNLDNDFCQAVIAGNTVYLRGQVAQDLDTRESLATGDPAGQAEHLMNNVEVLLAEAGSRLEDICRITDYITDIRYAQSSGSSTSQGRVSSVDRPRGGSSVAPRTS